jgi:predicted Fe-Mo cluster-binding NifX family protein
MKIAVITDDGKTISQHFGRAPYYMVLTIEDGKIINREQRNKLGHKHFSSQDQGEHHHGQDHGYDPATHNKHVSMAEAIVDCEVLLCGGMGMGAYDSMQRLNIQPIVTELNDIDEAVNAYLNGRLVDRTDLLH